MGNDDSSRCFERRLSAFRYTLDPKHPGLSGDTYAVSRSCWLVSSLYAIFRGANQNRLRRFSDVARFAFKHSMQHTSDATANHRFSY
jgi:hypothetical protein